MICQRYRQRAIVSVSDAKLRKNSGGSHISHGGPRAFEISLVMIVTEAGGWTAPARRSHRR